MPSGSQPGSGEGGGSQSATMGTVTPARPSPSGSAARVVRSVVSSTCRVPGAPSVPKLTWPPLLTTHSSPSSSSTVSSMGLRPRGTSACTTGRPWASGCRASSRPGRTGLRQLLTTA